MTALASLREKTGALAERLAWWIPAAFAVLFFGLEMAVVAHAMRLIFGTTTAWGCLGGILLGILPVAWVVANRRHRDEALPLALQVPATERHPVRTLAKQKTPPRRGSRKSPATKAADEVGSGLVKAWRAA